MMPLVRYGVPVLLALAGVAVLIARSDAVGLEVAFLFFGSSVSVLLLNLLFRLGVRGDEDRDREARARDEFTRTGRWPDDSG